MEQWESGYLPELLQFPHRRFTLESELPLEVAIERIGGIVQHSSLAMAGIFPSGKLFAGDFSPNRFKVFRIVPHYGRAMAIVEGSFASTPGGTRVDITMRLTRNNEFGAFLWFGIASLLLCACVLGPMLSPHMTGSAGFAMFIAMMIAVGYAILAVSFNREVLETQTLLREALQLRPSARIQDALTPDPARQKARRLKSARAFAIVAAAVGVLVFLILPTFTRHSEHFRVARQYIEANPEVRSELGTVTSVGPDRWRSDHENYVGTSEGDATFSLDVTGTSGNGVVSVRMQKHLGIWKVRSGELHESNGRTVALGTTGD
jgi:hypothetical protein